MLEDDFELLLVNARHVKQVPGRKTDVSDAAWLCRLLEAGLWRASLPPKPIRARQLTRYRKAQIKERQREANRLHKALEDTGIKLDCVATDILGVSGRAMLDALCQGTTDPELLAELARGKLRRKLPALREALEGRFDAARAADRIDPRPPRLPRRADRAALERDRSAAAPFSAGRWSCRARSTGSRPARRRASSPRSASTCRSSRAPPSSPPGQASVPATTSRPANAAPAARARARSGSRTPRWPRSEPTTATSSPIPAAATPGRPRPSAGRGHALDHPRLLTHAHAGELYRDLGGDYFRRRDPERQTKRLVTQLERLGHTVTLEKAAA
jgi:transposase